MYKNRYVQYLNLPQIPDEIISKLSLDPKAYLVDWTSSLLDQSATSLEVGPYVWSKSHNEEINNWCKKNICQEIFWAFQFMTADVEVHKDAGTTTKLNYVISTGGDSWTDFYADDMTTLLASYKIEPHRWHILKADTFHRVRNIQPGLVRFAVTGRIFGVEP